MGITDYGKQLRPREQRSVNHIEKIKSLYEAASKLPQEKEISVDSLVSAEDSAIATEMYEAAAVIVGMAGLKLSKQKLLKVMNHREFSPKAKIWIEGFFETHSNKEALDAFLEWVIFIGGAVVDVYKGTFKDFIHKSSLLHHISTFLVTKTMMLFYKFI